MSPGVSQPKAEEDLGLSVRTPGQALVRLPHAVATTENLFWGVCKSQALLLLKAVWDSERDV